MPRAWSCNLEMSGGLVRRTEESRVCPLTLPHTATRRRRHLPRRGAARRRSWRCSATRPSAWCRRCTQRKRLATSAVAKFEDMRRRTERESGKLERQTSPKMGYSVGIPPRFAQSSLVRHQSCAWQRFPTSLPRADARQGASSVLSYDSSQASQQALRARARRVSLCRAVTLMVLGRRAVHSFARAGMPHEQ